MELTSQVCLLNARTCTFPLAGQGQNANDEANECFCERYSDQANCYRTYGDCAINSLDQTQKLVDLYCSLQPNTIVTSTKTVTPPITTPIINVDGTLTTTYAPTVTQEPGVPTTTFAVTQAVDDGAWTLNGSAALVRSSFAIASFAAFALLVA